MRNEILGAIAATYCLSGAASAAILTERLETTMDLTSLGGGAADTVIIEFEFDTGAADVDPDPTYGEYFTLGGTLTVGAETATFQAGQITVADGGGVDFYSFATSPDLFGAFPAEDNFSGLILGGEVTYLSFGFIGDMFTGDALPQTPDFANGITAFIDLSLVEEDASRQDTAPIFTIGDDVPTPVPAPLPLALIATGLVGFLGLRRISLA